jgi:hypothetical protein
VPSCHVLPRDNWYYKLCICLALGCAHLCVYVYTHTCKYTRCSIPHFSHTNSTQLYILFCISFFST